MMRILLLAPIYNSLYARLVAKGILEEKGLDLTGIVVRSHLNPDRFRSELNRDGPQLLRKILERLFLGDNRFEDRLNDNLSSLAKTNGLDIKTLPGLCRDKAIPFTLVRDLNSPRSLAFIKNLKPDVIIFTGGGLIRKQILSIPRLGVLNCHSGILPSYRGMDVVEWTAAEGNACTVGYGVTQHQMDNGVDTGPILQKENITIQKSDTFRSIRERIEVLMVKLMLSGLRSLRDGKIHLMEQTPHAGRQYFVMHPRIRQYAEKMLKQDF
jgi:methionyl-tRNA formyltransferase